MSGRAEGQPGVDSPVLAPEFASAIDGLSTKLPPHRVLPEPILAFNASASNAEHIHPLRGLVKFGPHSRDTFATFRPAVRVATITPADSQTRVFEFLKSLQAQHDPRERIGYLPVFPGFNEVFGVQVHGAVSDAHVKLAPTLVDDAQDKPAALAGAIRHALDRLQAFRDEFDVVAIHVPDHWSAGFEDLDTGFDLHDEIKSIAAVSGVPTQFLQDRALTYFDRCSVAWRLGIALYAKAGGTPWRLVPAMTDTAYVGLSYAIRGGTRDRFVTCCSQVFDADGGGMEFVAYDVGDGVDFDNPFLTRGDMRAVMARSVVIYQARHAGRLPRRVVIHKTQPFRDDELDGCLDAWSSVDELECVQVQSSSDWRAVRLLAPPSGSTERSQPDGWPVMRGTLVPLSGQSVLLFVSGNAPGVSDKGNFFQGGKGIPRPITLVRHAGSGSLEVLGDDALALSKMDWNNDALYDPLPVTIRYSQVLARTIAHATVLPGGVYPYRLFM
jgi:hypothetical protein